jgi:RNA polymerase sigma-70 factor (ECF subfamily)
MQAPDPILVLRAQTGDRDALDALLRMCQSPLHRYINGLVGDATAAEDVLQECLLRIARKLKWLSDPSLFRAWAFRIASRESHRYLSRHRRSSSIEDADMPSVEPEALSAMELATVRHAVATLSPASRAIVSLHYFEEMPLLEIAEVLEIPLGTVKSRLWYGLKQLRSLVRKA